MPLGEKEDEVSLYILKLRLGPYVIKAREWWESVDSISVANTGVYSIPDSPPGMSYRFTRSAKKSPILNIQAFPFVPTAYLQLTGIAGGSVKMVERVCPFEMDEFTIIAKSNLPSTYNQGQFVAFIPTAIIEGIKELGQWIYVNEGELAMLVNGIVPETIKDKARLRV